MEHLRALHAPSSHAVGRRRLRRGRAALAGRGGLWTVSRGRCFPPTLMGGPTCLVRTPASAGAGRVAVFDRFGRWRTPDGGSLLVLLVNSSVCHKSYKPYNKCVAWTTAKIWSSCLQPTLVSGGGARPLIKFGDGTLLLAGVSCLTLLSISDGRNAMWHRARKDKRLFHLASVSFALQSIIVSVFYQ